MTWKPTMQLTEAEVEAGKSRKGGFTAKQLAKWGVPWPPPAGWRAALTGRPLSERGTPQNIVTLFTDASHDHKLKIATYAIWAKYRGETIRHSGVLRGNIDKTQIAELRALSNGIAIVVAQLAPPPGTKIIAQTDCMTAIHVLQGKLGKRRTTRYGPTPELEVVRDKLGAAQVTIEYRHVKGHRGNQDKRSAVNTWCDRECRRLLRQARREAAQPKES